MEVYEFKGINKEEALKKAENELCIDREALIIEEEIENKETKKTMFSILDRDNVTLKISVNEDKKEKNTNDEIVAVKRKKTAKEAVEELNRREQGIEEDDASENTVKNILNKVKQKGGTITYGELAAELRRC